jgi:acyl-CoA synthetase (AMP-forming)/AMP-acid ligase II
MLLHHFLENSAEKYPDKGAVWYKDLWASYLNIEQNANRIANFLIENGISRGDRVSLLMENSINYIISYFGILKAGAVVVAINNEVTSDNLLFYLNNSESSAIIAGIRFSTLFSILSHAPSVKFIICDSSVTDPPKTAYSMEDILKSEKTYRPVVATISIDLASIVYTSGSTGKPKGVMLSHQNLSDNTISISQYLKLTPEDRIMVVLPLYYIYGNSLMTTHFFCGGSVVIDNRFMFPNLVIETMRKMQVTGFAGVPSTYMILLNKSSIRQCKLESLRYLTQAGGSMPPQIQLQVAETFAPAKLYVMYGTTEAAPRLTYLEPEMLSVKLGSIGKAIPNVEVIIADENGKALPAGHIGEIAARGSNIMLGYWKDPQSSAAVLRNGYYFTGDLGKTDEDGYIYVVGRIKDMIKVGGNRVSAKEVEEALLNLPHISEAAVIGVPDSILGEAIKAFIVPKTDQIPDASEIKRLLSSLISPYKIPSIYSFHKELPKNESGKIMKEKLRNESTIPTILPASNSPGT